MSVAPPGKGVWVRGVLTFPSATPTPSPSAPIQSGSEAGASGDSFPTAPLADSAVLHGVGAGAGFTREKDKPTMNIRASKADLLRAAKVAASCVAAGTDPIRSAVRISAGPDGVTISGVSHGLSASVTVPGAEVIDRGEVGIGGETLLRAVSAMGDTGSLSVEANKLVLRSGAVTARLNRHDAADLLPFPALDTVGATIRIDGAALRSAVHRMGYAVAPDDNKYGMNLAYIESAQDGVRFVASDGNRLAYVDVLAEVTGLKLGQRLPRVLVTALKDAKDGETVLTFDDRRVQVSTPGMVLFAAQATGDFPDYQQVLPKQYKQRVSISRDEMFGAVSTLVKSLAMTGPNAAVEMKVNDGSIGLRVRVIDAGDADATLDAETTGEPFVWGVSPRYLLDVLATIGAERFKWEFSGALAPARITSEGDNAVHIIMPVRLD